MSRLAILILLFAPVLAAQDDAARVPALIEQLGSEDWRAREKATRALIGLDETARDGLRGALTHDDAEVRARASSALIDIGESFGFAVQCATAEDALLHDHGRAALMNLFRIDDPKILRALSPQELVVRGYQGGQTRQIIQPPPLALAQLMAVTGLAIVISDDAREQWGRVLEQASLNITIRSGIHTQYIVQALNASLQAALGQPKPEEQLTARPMRIGTATFLYITPATRGGSSLQCGRELIAALLADGHSRTTAAALLAQGAAGDTESAGRIRDEYLAHPEIERLMWLALALGEHEAVARQAAKADPAAAIALLATQDWPAFGMAARFLHCLTPEARGEALSPILAQATDSLQVTAALWIARGCTLSAPARARVGKLLTSRQDSLAAAAVRWFGGAELLTDEELAAIWKAAENQQLSSNFFQHTLALIARADIAERLVSRAREALNGNQTAPQALAAQILVGRADSQDIARMLDRLGRASNDAQLASRLTAMLDGATSLPDEARKRLLDALTDSNPAVRQVYLRALRRLGQPLRLSICDLADERLNESAKTAEGKSSLNVLDEAYKEADAWIMEAHIALVGIRGGTGDLGAIEQLTRHVERENAGLAKAAGTAIVDALKGDVLFNTIEDWKSRVGLVHGGAAAVQAYAEICRRAAEEKDRDAFRRAFGAAMSINTPDMWQLRHELSRLQTSFNEGVDEGQEQPLPPDLNLTQANVDVG